MSDRPIIEELSEIFQQLPGIGPRQAKRFVYALLEKESIFLTHFANLLTRLPLQVKRCTGCFWAFEDTNATLCCLCANPNRNQALVMVVERDTDLTAIERSGIYSGRYLVLGGVVAPLKAEPYKGLHLEELYRMVAQSGITEIILALGASADGEATGLYIERMLEPIGQKKKIHITRLGRGLSSGAELEYSDEETIKHAFRNRK